MKEDKRYEDDEDFERKRQINSLFSKYMEVLSKEDIELAFEMYKKGSTYEQIEGFLKIQAEKAKRFGNIDYYGGRTLKEARDEIADDWER